MALEDIFRAYKLGSVRAVRERLARLDKKREKDMRESLAYLSVQERQPGMLRLCFEGPFRYEEYFRDEADSVDLEKHPKTFQVLEDSDFRQSCPRRDPDHKNGSDSGSDSGMGYDEQEEDDRFREAVAATFDVGGSHPVEW